MNMWNSRYGEPGFAYGTEPNAFLAANIGYFPAGARVLSLAEGEGRNAVFLARHGCRVTAVDSSEVGLEKARQLAMRAGVEIETVAADLAAFDVGEERWDGVVSIWCHLPPALRMRLHRDVVRGLRPGGLLLLEAYTPAQLDYRTGGPQSAELMMTLAGLGNELAGLTFVHAEETTREIHEGKYHNGVGAVVQLIARKPA